MKSCIEIKKQANENFKKQYWVSVAAFTLYTVISSILSGASLGIAAFLLMPPLTVGYSYFSLKVYKGEISDVRESLGTGFNDYIKSLGGILWMNLFTFLWTLLFIIPGIVKAIAYSMTPYILVDMKDVKATEALKISMRMTDGYKGKIFVMMLSFIGWWILSAMTFGILAIFYTGPYTATSFAGLYFEIKQNALKNNLLSS